MRVAVVYFQSGSSAVKKTAEALAQGIASGNHMVDLIDGETDIDKKLTGYEYLCIGTTPISAFRGRISDRISNYLAGSGMVSGKRSYAFIKKKGFGSSRALKTLMKSMEKEGMMLKTSDILCSVEEANAYGKKLHIKK